MLEAGFENSDQLSSVIALKQLITSWLESGDNYDNDNGEISAFSRISLLPHGIYSAQIVGRSLGCKICQNVSCRSSRAVYVLNCSDWKREVIYKRATDS